MFFSGIGSSLIPYILSLVIIWGVLLVNGIFKTQLRKEIQSENTLRFKRNDVKRSANGKTYFYFNKIKRKIEKTKINDFNSHCFLKPKIILKVLEKIIFDSDNSPAQTTLLRAPPSFCIC